MKQPTVTVFIPCYNAERFISETIDSILGQTYQDFELLIIDDGSTDHSMEIVASYANKDDRIRILQNQINRGVAYTRNRGVQEARGKYLATMDADDIATPFRLEMEVKYLEQHKSVGAVSGCLYRISERGVKIGKSSKTGYTALEVMATMFFENIILNSASMYRLDLVRKYCIQYQEDFHGVEDYMFWCMLLQHTQIVVLGEYFVYYRIVKSGLTVTNVRTCNEKRSKCIETVQNYMLKSNGFHINKWILQYCLPRCAAQVPQGSIKNIVLFSAYIAQIVIQAKQMNKPYYPQIKAYGKKLVKKMIHI